MIQLEHLTAGYGGSPILKDVTLTCPRGQLTVLLGPNGSGKSTLLKTMVGLVPIGEGSVRVAGQPLEELSPRALARQLAYLPQSRRVPDMTAAQLVLHGRFPHLGYPRRYSPADRAIAADALAQVGMADRAHTPLAQLSGGQRQRAYIAMALAQDSPFIALDEPTAFLDIAHQLELMALCRALARRGKGVILVLHDLNLALEYADRIALLYQGGLYCQGSPRDVYASGALEQVFGVAVGTADTSAGPRYYCLPK